MDRNDCIHVRVSTAEKHRITEAAQQAHQSVADYLRAVAFDRITAEQQADRLLAALLAAIGDGGQQVGEHLDRVSEYLTTLASKDDLRKLAEWMATKFESIGAKP